MAASTGPRLTIGQAASYAGVTTRAVRHYHQVGLLPEPPRDASGYRRYGARDVMELIRIRALADAGVPLGQVGELLAAGPAELARAVEEIDRRLRTEIERLEARRVAVAQLDTVEGLGLSPDVVDYLEHLRRLGFSERMVEIERDGWLIVNAQVPDQIGTWIEDKRAAFDDPRVLAVYRDLDAALGWAPDDPRLERIADALSELFHLAAEAGVEATDAGAIDDVLTAMLDAESVGASPSWTRLGQLLEARGWFGWNDVGLPVYDPPDA